MSTSSSFPGVGKTTQVIEAPINKIQKQQSTGGVLSKLWKKNIHLEELIDSSDLEKFQKNGYDLKNINIKKLYQVNSFQKETGLYSHHREVTVICGPNDTVKLKLLDPESFRILLDTQKYRFMHMGLIVVGIRGLIRKDVGAKALISVMDTRWDTAKYGMTGMGEADLNPNNVMFHIAPDFPVTIRDLDKIVVGIQTKGFSGDANLVVTIAFYGRLGMNLNMQYKLVISNIVKMMASQGIAMLDPKKIDPNERAYEEWDLSKLIEDAWKPLIPQESLIYTNSNKKRVS